ncbi:MAG: NFACT RNA binding domain-containing protein [Chloroflexota bacterium]
MPFDAITMAAVADEVEAAASSGRIQRILQPSPFAVALAAYTGGAQFWLVLSADPEHARAHMTREKQIKAFATPSAFVMLLRKYLEGARLLGATATRGERILTVRCRGANEIRLIAEVMGRHSNVILVDADDTILGAVKGVSPRQSSVRPIAPGLPYHTPPEQGRDTVIFPPGGRVDPYRSPGDFESLLGDVPASVPLRTALQGLLLGSNPFLVGQIMQRAGLPADKEVGRAAIAAVLAAAIEIYSLYATRAWQPCTFVNNRGRTDACPYPPVGVRDVEPVESISAALDVAASGRESQDAYSVARRRLIDDIGKRARALKGRLAALQEGLDAAAGADYVKEQGQLVLAYGYSVTTGADVLEIPDLHTSIPLDPRLSPADNAERLFKRYRKLRDARLKIPALQQATKQAVERLEEMSRFAQIAESDAALSEIRRDLEGDDRSEVGKHGTTRKRQGPPRYRFQDVTAVVGRNARENEEVTFKVARRDDLWLHARERTGAHVVLTGTGEVGDAVLEAAAELAAYFSDGRDDTGVDVDITQVRNVRKIPGGPPGRVTYGHFRTVRVLPSRGRWTPVARSR